MSQIKNIPLSQLHTDGLQVRAETDRAHVDGMVELFSDVGQWPATLPPLTIFHDGENYFLADGHHRHQAAHEAGCESAPCEVRQGDRTAALWCAIASNSAHGLRRSNEDKRRAVLMAYELDGSLSDREIARRARVSPDMANYILRPLRSKGRLSDRTVTNTQTESLSTSQIAKCENGEQDTAPPFDEPDAAPAAATEPTASSSTRPVSPAGSSPEQPSAPAIADKPAPDMRTDSRGRQMNVSRIGKWQRSGNPGPSAAVPRGVDELGVPIPSAATAKAFEALDFFVELDSWAMQGAKLLDRLGKMEGGELLRTNYLNLKSSSHNGQVVKHLRSPDLENLRRELAHWRPYAAVCPQCRGEPKPACLACQGLPYVIKAVWNRAPEKLRQAVLAKTTAATG